MAWISSKAFKSDYAENKKGYNGNEIQNGEFTLGSGLELYDFNARIYDQQIGQFIQIDPEAENFQQENLTPYHFSENDPIRNNDPTGRCTNCPGFAPALPWIAKAVAAAAVVFTSYEAGKHISNIVNNPGPEIIVGSTLGVPTGTTFRVLNSEAPAPNIESKPKGTQNPKTKEAVEIGQEADRQIQNELQKEGAEIEVPMTLKDGSNIRKDAVRQNGTLVIIKPNTKSGNKSAAKRENILKINDDQVKLEKIFYDPFDLRYKPSSPTYIGPK